MQPYDLQNGAPALHSVIAIKLSGIDDTAATASTFDPQVTAMVDDITDGDEFDVCAHAASKER